MFKDILVVAGVPSDTSVRTGYSHSLSPDEQGPWSLYERRDVNNDSHMCFLWRKEALETAMEGETAKPNCRFSYSWIR